jgi:hypothetical protein
MSISQKYYYFTDHDLLEISGSEPGARSRWTNAGFYEGWPPWLILQLQPDRPVAGSR